MSMAGWRDRACIRRTSRALRPLTRRGWSLFDAVELDPSDVDQVLVGPGGVFVMNTVRSTEPVQLNPTAIEGLAGGDPAIRARSGAFKIRSLLRTDGLVLDVRPVVVLAGPGAPSLERGWSVVGDGAQDVVVFEARQLRDRLDRLAEHGLDQLSLATARSTVARHLAGRDDCDCVVVPI
jgi:hypothetical protein